MKVFVILCVVFACAVANQYNAPAPVIKAMTALTNSTVTADDSTKSETATLKDNVSKGSHSFTGDDGKVYTVKWTASDKESTATSDVPASTPAP